MVAALKFLRDTLNDDVALKEYAQNHWGKALSVRITYRNRTEISLTDLPVVLITRPEVRPTDLVGSRKMEHRVRLYCGFHQRDPEKAALEMVEFEDLLEDAVMKNRRQGGHARYTAPAESANDEGRNHPSYFIVKDFLVGTEKL